MVLIAALAALLGFALAGSTAKLPAGTRIAGVAVSGLEAGEARAKLERRSESLRRVPVIFTAGGREWRVRPSELGVDVDWSAAVEAARRQGEGFGPFQGLKRLGVRVFGVDVAPPTRVYEPALDHRVDEIAKAVDQSPREAAVRLRGLRTELVAAQTGRRLDREEAAHVLVRALAGFSRAPVALPVEQALPAVPTAELAPVAAQVRTAVSAPVTLTLGDTRWRIPRWRVAQLLDLPQGGERRLEIGGAAANRWFASLRKNVDRPAKDAAFVVASGDRVVVVPDQPGREVDEQATATALLAGALAQSARTAKVVVETAEAERTLAEARAMGITGVVGAYTTIYGGETNRLHNVRLVAELIDEALIAPGTTFSFNDTTGERSADKGFLEAPVIINGELQTGLGGGVCQVSTTVFNTAYEAGLPISSRVNHALYISHYPLGRDATVNYPDIDLRFVNDTGNWLLLRAFVGTSELTVKLYGTPVGRRVETITEPLRVTGPPPVEKTRDPKLLVGKTAVDDMGEPSRATSVRRLVYDAGGKLIDEDVWSSSYRGEKRLIRVGTKKPPKEKKKPKNEDHGEVEPLPPPEDPSQPPAEELPPGRPA